MAGELVETSRLWARQNAAIKPEWAEKLAGDLAKRTYSEPHWSKKRAAVMAYERVTLYGVPLVADRLISYGKVDVPLARELFIRHALVYGEWNTRHRFMETNRRLLEEAEELEHRARRRDIVVDEHTLFDFYDARVGPDVVSGAHFDQWWKHERHQRPDLLDLRPVDAHPRHRRGGQRGRLPGPVASTSGGGLTFPISYHFEPGAADDGLTIDVPGRDPQPGRGRRLLLERPGPARGAGHQPDPQPAEEPAGHLRAGAQQGAGVPGRGPAGGGAAARRARALVPLDDRRRRAARGVGLVQGRRAPAPDVPRRRRGRPGAGPRQGPRGAEGAAAAAVRGGHRRGRDRQRAGAHR